MYDLYVPTEQYKSVIEKHKAQLAKLKEGKSKSENVPFFFYVCLGFFFFFFF